MAYPKSLRVLEFLHFGGDMPIVAEEYTVRSRSLTKTNTFFTERRPAAVKLDTMESWYSKECNLNNMTMGGAYQGSSRNRWLNSFGNEILRSTHGVVEEYLEVYPEALQSLDRVERNADRMDNKERKEFYRHNNVPRKWLSEDYLQSAKPRKGQA